MHSKQTLFIFAFFFLLNTNLILTIHSTSSPLTTPPGHPPTSVQHPSHLTYPLTQTTLASSSSSEFTNLHKRGSRGRRNRRNRSRNRRRRNRKNRKRNDDSTERDQDSLENTNAREWERPTPQNYPQNAYEMHGENTKSRFSELTRVQSQQPSYHQQPSSSNQPWIHSNQRGSGFQPQPPSNSVYPPQTYYPMSTGNGYSPVIVHGNMGPPSNLPPSNGMGMTPPQYRTTSSPYPISPTGLPPPQTPHPGEKGVQVPTSSGYSPLPPQQDTNALGHPSLAPTSSTPTSSIPLMYPGGSSSYPSPSYREALPPTPPPSFHPSYPNPPTHHVDDPSLHSRRSQQYDRSGMVDDEFEFEDQDEFKHRQPPSKRGRGNNGFQGHAMETDAFMDSSLHGYRRTTKGHRIHHEVEEEEDNDVEE
ncbi:hypothetical protein HMI54_010983 [Coelomomyces lativittatus]|nr:hypothetical protein HMI56_004018 [Coelomomyces lativittatus]KAJ1514725.1 hypothetical protein HMI55_004427 [Coelomomyces lativittatus]KAJ1516059.1 hypothetical protein HMI54_010983 [Coelomomyces lativittatus]